MMRETVGGETPNIRAICAAIDLPSEDHRLVDLTALGVVQPLAAAADVALRPGSREASRCPPLQRKAVAPANGTFIRKIV